MKINYYPEIDSLNIDLTHKTSVESREVSDGIALDYDETGNLFGLDIGHASLKLDVSEIVLGRLPIKTAHVLA